MQSTANDATERCVQNLFLTVRGQVPYSRMKGLSASVTDRPSTTVDVELLSDAEWVLEQYEPRAALDSVAVQAELAQIGHFALNINTTNKE